MKELTSTLINLSKDRSLRTLTLIIVIYLFFHEFFIEIFDKYFVETIFNKIKSNNRNDILFGLSCIFLFIRFIQLLKRGYCLSLRTLIFLLIIPSFYLWYRLSGIWNFTRINSIQLIAYSDIILFFGFLETLVYIVGVTSKSETINNNLGFLFDEPLKGKEPDLLNRENIAKAICRKIEYTSSPDKSFAIGIYGEWGSGKTSFLWLIERNINREKFLIIHFNPWLNKGAGSIISDFFNTLIEKLKDFHSNLSDDVEVYAKTLLKLDTTWVSNILSSIFTLRRKYGTASDEYKRINNGIKNLNKKLLIIIDNLDRLDKKEVVEVLRLIRNTASFRNTIFLVAYDKHYVNTAIKEINPNVKELFLEKIFQVEIPLMKFENLRVKNILKGLIISNLRVEDRVEIEKVLSDSNIMETWGAIDPIRIIYSIRDAKRFANLFLLTYNELKENTVVEDLFLLEIIKFKFPSVYQVFFRLFYRFIELKQIAVNDRYTLKKNENGNYILEEYLNNHFEELEVHEYQVNEIMKIFKNLFPESESPNFLDQKNYLSLANYNSFYKYFFLGLTSTNIDETEFNKLRKGDFADFSKKISEWVNKDFDRELRERFGKKHVYKSKIEFENFIKGILYFANLMKISSFPFPIPTPTRLGFDYSILYSILNDVQIIKDFYQNTSENYHNFLEKIFVQKESFIYSAEFVEFILNDRHSYTLNEKKIKSDALPPNVILVSIQNKGFSNYINSCEKLSEDLWKLYHVCRMIPDKNDLSKEFIKNQHITKIFVDFIFKKDLYGFVSSSISISKDESKQMKYKLNDNIPLIFEDYGSFLERISKLKEKEFPFIKEYQDFYIKCRENGYQKFINYQFSKLKLN